MSTKFIKVVTDFHNKPYGRYVTDGPGCDLTSGEVFRKKILAPALRQYDEVSVDLTGYNRYGRSFLDEAFGGLIREEGFTKSDLLPRLTYKHDLIPSIEKLIDDRVDAAERERVS
ncbi:DUF4325 domain-containing protein [Agarivorans sp. B2Z047]|uniref:STAS-like domain-containing protein n=1 Tax=Agarivorans sp. B2Z047 TaxID=2652721 RepID=UPI00128DBB66|nr:STAS-like domain-containing protein [Agarivorans sp. B2Z047]MPW31530.1 DUF4325 domain-containing protein [Agarivorans sp. B2Z047]UQN42573.1 STAS-like domain-containing protein [Agarivorans sp. B2Z047]